MFSFLTNIPQVTKNILILNVLFFVLTVFFEGQGIDLNRILGAHYFNSPLFRPYQMVTHFFMHVDIGHIFMNMWLFVMLGGYLEKLWGPKRFFVFYVTSALGALVLYNCIGVYQIYELKNQLSALEITRFDNALNINMHYTYSSAAIRYASLCATSMSGASGGVFGIMAAFAILFPNTEFRLYFAIPVKAKYLVGGYFLLELYLSFQHSADDSIAHLAHVGGAIVGAIVVFYWRKIDRKHFY